MENYDVLRPVGRGAFAVVHLCKHKATGQPVVVKSFSTSLAELSPKGRAELAQEVKLLAHLKHPNIVAFEDFFLDSSGSAHLVMEYCSAGTLHQVLQGRQGALLPEAHVMDVFVQVVDALKYVHANNVLHRDIKSCNILLCPRSGDSSAPCGELQGYIAKLGDFGIAKVLGDGRQLAATVVGTPFYLSPEVAMGKSYDVKSDMWALGVVLYELLALHRPFEASNLPAVIFAIMRATPQPLPPEGGYSTNMQQLVDRLLSKDPEGRPTTSDILALPWVQEHVKRLQGAQAARRTPIRARTPSSSHGQGRSFPAFAGTVTQQPVAASTSERGSLLSAQTSGLPTSGLISALGTGGAFPSAPAAPPLLSQPPTSAAAAAGGTGVTNGGTSASSIGLPVPAWAIRDSGSDLNSVVATAQTRSAPSTKFGQSSAGGGLGVSMLKAASFRTGQGTPISIGAVGVGLGQSLASMSAPLSEPVEGLAAGTSTGLARQASPTTSSVITKEDIAAAADPSVREALRVSMYLNRVHAIMGRCKARMESVPDTRQEATGVQVMGMHCSVLPGDVQQWVAILQDACSLLGVSVSTLGCLSEGDQGEGVSMEAVRGVVDKVVAVLPPQRAALFLSRLEVHALQLDILEEDVALRKGLMSLSHAVAHSREARSENEATTGRSEDELVEEAGAVAGVVWEAVATAWAGTGAWHVAARCYRRALARRNAPYPPTLAAGEQLGVNLIRSAMLAYTAAQAGREDVAHTIAMKAIRKPGSVPSRHRSGSSTMGASGLPSTTHADRTPPISPMATPSVEDLFCDLLLLTCDPCLMWCSSDASILITSRTRGQRIVHRASQGPQAWRPVAVDIMTEGMHMVTRMLTLGATHKRYTLALHGYRIRAWTGLLPPERTLESDLEEGSRLAQLLHEEESVTEPGAGPISSLMTSITMRALLLQGRAHEVQRLREEAREAEHWAEVRKAMMPTDLQRWVCAVDCRFLRYVLGDTASPTPAGVGTRGAGVAASGGPSKAGPAPLTLQSLASEYRAELALGATEQLRHSVLGDIQWLVDVSARRLHAVVELLTSMAAQGQAPDDWVSIPIPQRTYRRHSHPMDTTSASEHDDGTGRSSGEGIGDSSGSGRGLGGSDVWKIAREQHDWLLGLHKRATTVLEALLHLFAPHEAVRLRSAESQDSGASPDPATGQGLAHRRDAAAAAPQALPKRLVQPTAAYAVAPLLVPTGMPHSSPLPLGAAGMLPAISEEEHGGRVSMSTSVASAPHEPALPVLAPPFSASASALPQSASMSGGEVREGMLQPKASPSPSVPARPPATAPALADSGKLLGGTDVPGRTSEPPPLGLLPLTSHSSTGATGECGSMGVGLGGGPGGGGSSSREVHMAPRPFRPSPLSGEVHTVQPPEHSVMAQQGPRPGWQSAWHARQGGGAAGSAGAGLGGGAGDSPSVRNPFARSTPQQFRFTPPEGSPLTQRRHSPDLIPSALHMERRPSSLSAPGGGAALHAPMARSVTTSDALDRLTQHERLGALQGSLQARGGQSVFLPAPAANSTITPAASPALSLERSESVAILPSQAQPLPVPAVGERDAAGAAPRQEREPFRQRLRGWFRRSSR